METVSSITWARFSVVSLECITGIFTNCFNILNIFVTNGKHQDISGSEKIIVALSISNLCYTCAIFGNIVIFTIWPILVLTTDIYPAFFASTFFIIFSSAWLTASLGFYYYVKIKNLSSDLFSRLKRKISSLASCMIGVSVLLSLLCSLLNVLQIFVQKKTCVSSSVFPNASCPYTTYKVSNSNLYITFVGSLIPFFISVTTTASISWSLHLHKLTIVRDQTSSTNVNVRKYERTIKIMICMLTFYALIFVSLCLYYFNAYNPHSQVFWGFLFIICSYSPLQSVLLSLSTTKLKRTWMKLFNCKARSNDDDGNRVE